MLLDALWNGAITVYQLVLLVWHHHLQLRLGDLHIRTHCDQYISTHAHNNKHISGHESAAAMTRKRIIPG